MLLVTFADLLPGDDGNRYLRDAVNLWTFGVYSDHVAILGVVPSPSAHDLPLYPMLLASLLAVVKSPLVAAKLASLLNCVFFGVAAHGVYVLATRLTQSPKTATYAMAIFGCFPGSYPYSVFYMPESLFSAIFVWCLIAFVEVMHTDNVYVLLRAFLLWGLSILAKPIAILFGPVMAAMVLFRAYRLRQNITRSLVTTSLALILGASVTVPWLFRNYITFGVVGLSSITGTNPFYCNYLYMLEDMGTPNAPQFLADREAEVVATIPVGTDNAMVHASALGNFARREIAANWGHYIVTVIKRHPKLYTSTGAVDTLRLFGDTDGVSAMEETLAGHRGWRDLPLRALCVLTTSWLLLCAGYVAACLGLLSLARQRNWDALAIVLTTVVYFAVVIGPVTSARYRFVMLPTLAIAAAVGLRGSRLGG